MLLGQGLQAVLSAVAELAVPLSHMKQLMLPETLEKEPGDVTEEVTEEPGDVTEEVTEDMKPAIQEVNAELQEVKPCEESKCSSGLNPSEPFSGVISVHT